LDLSKSFLKDKLVINPDLMPSIRSYYNAPLRIAKTIIENRGIELDRSGDDILLPSLVLRLEEVFEKYTREILREKMNFLEPTLRVLDGNLQGFSGGAKLLFDPPSKEKANPDIVFKYETEAGSMFPLIIDVKYKNIERPDREDLNQIIGYACSYRAPNVVILHPKKKNSVAGLNLLGRIDKLHVYHYAFDLASENPEQEEEKLFSEILSLIPQIKKP
jgi:5-methylcytosine-specific restriction endonuclease McrBC regulatory subunit McrC